MARIRPDYLGGTITDNPLLIGATTLNSAALASLPAVAAPDVCAITLDPGAAIGAPEIVVVTAHTGSATSATIVRASEGSTARQHTTGERWVCAPTAWDYIIPCVASGRPSSPWPGMSIWETDTKLLRVYDGTNWLLLNGESAWTAVSYANSWVDSGGANQAVAFRLVGTRVVFRGAMKSGTVGSASFTLPAGYRPPGTVNLSCPSSNGTNFLAGAISITSAGVVTTQAGTGTSNVFVGLDGLSFDTV